ncbi:MAG: Sir2 family NAD-dependent protein deacetylase [Adlercreutzia equolifaciens]
MTQNIDGLHQRPASTQARAGLHGGVWRNFCMGCGAASCTAELLALREQSPGGVPRCAHCGAPSRGRTWCCARRPLDDATVTWRPVRAMNNSADLLLRSPARAWPCTRPRACSDYFRGDRPAVINRTPTPRDAHAPASASPPTSATCWDTSHAEGGHAGDSHAEGARPRAGSTPVPVWLRGCKALARLATAPPTTRQQPKPPRYLTFRHR